jgi:hypothetical protein
MKKRKRINKARTIFGADAMNSFRIDWIRFRAIEKSTFIKHLRKNVLISSENIVPYRFAFDSIQP